MNLPNRLTLLRIGLIPFFMLAFYFDFSSMKIMATVIFILASITDFADGYIARKQNLITDFGKVMDTIADKTLVCAALLLFIEDGRMSAIIGLILIGRELVVSGFRILAASKGNVIPAGKTGKWKTATQMVMIVAFLLFDPKSSSIMGFVIIIENVLLYASVFLSLFSAYEYISKSSFLIQDK